MFGGAVEHLAGFLGGRFPGDDEEVGVDLLGTVEDDAAGMAGFLLNRKAIRRRGCGGHARLPGDFEDGIDERLGISGEFLLVDGAGLDAANALLAEDVDDVDGRAVFLRDSDGVLDGRDRALGAINRNEDGFDRQVVAHARLCVAGPQKSTRWPGGFIPFDPVSPDMFDTLIVATDGSDSVERAVGVALDLADRFDANVHALYVLDSSEVEASPDGLREDLHDALERQGEEALEAVAGRTDREITTATREGRPIAEICAYARDHDADAVATGTRGRHGENRLLLGSVAEGVVRTCPVPVLTVRQLDAEAGIQAGA